MPPVQSNLHNFFKRFTVPKERVPDTSHIEDDITVRPVVRKQIVQDATIRRKRSPQDTVATRQSRVHSPRKTTTMRSSSPTLTQQTPKSSPRQPSAITSLDAAADDVPLLHSSPQPSTQRHMKAVELPSPKPKAPLTAPMSAQATTSFSSISTLSSVPLSSQSSSRRVVKKGGVIAVTNSESGTDSSSSDDNNDLADLESFMPARKRVKLTPTPPPPTTRNDAARRQSGIDIEIPDTAKPAARQSKRLSDRTTINSSSSKATEKKRTSRFLPPPSPPKAAYKHNLLNIVKAHALREAQDARIAEAEAELVAAAAKLEAERAERGALKLDAQGVAHALMAEDDSDEGAKMMQAMARTEALREEDGVPEVEREGRGEAPGE